MNELQFTGFQESTTLDSRIVAQMLDKNHSDLIRDIKKYTEYLGESKIAFTDFFQESQYITTQNKILPNYQITKNVNQCLNCHSVEASRVTGATRISPTHFADRDGNIGASASPRRYFCLQCHVSQSDVEPLVPNEFKPMKGYGQ